MADPNVLHLRCEASLEDDPGTVAYVEVPVDRMFWEATSDETREMLRNKTRQELQNHVQRKTGKLLSDAYLSRLAVMVDEPRDKVDAPPVTGHEVVLTGGPADGERMILNGVTPLPAVQIPVPPPLTAHLVYEAATGLPEKLPVADYTAIVDDLGFHSRADDGAWRYQYTGQ